MDIVKIWFNDYDLITPIIIKKYNLNLPLQLEFLNNCNGKGELQILDEDKVYKFIEDMSLLDIVKEKSRVNIKKDDRSRLKWLINSFK